MASMPNKRRKTLEGVCQIASPLLDLDDEPLALHSQQGLLNLIATNSFRKHRLDDAEVEPMDRHGLGPTTVPSPSTPPIPLYQVGNDQTDTSTNPALTSIVRTTNADMCTANERANDMSPLLDALSNAPTTDSNNFSLVSRLEWSLPLPIITSMLRSAHSLTTISLHSIVFEGGMADFDDFCECFKHHPSLEEIHLVDCCLADQTVPIDSLLRVLALMPNLQTVEVHALDLERETSICLMSPTSLGYLCRSPTITSLSLEDLDLNDDHVRELANALRQNDTMTKLTLWDCNITDIGGQHLANVMRENTTLKKIDLSFNALTNRTYYAIASGIAHNHTLKILALFGNRFLHNRTDRLSGGGREAERATSGSKDGYEVLVSALRDQNHVLEELILDTEEDPRIDLYLAINKNQHLLHDHNATQERLVECLIGYNSLEGKHMSFVFHLLQSKPQLCNLHAY